MVSWIKFESAYESLTNLNFVFFKVNEFEFKNYKKMNGFNPSYYRKNSLGQDSLPINHYKKYYKAIFQTQSNVMWL